MANAMALTANGWPRAPTRWRGLPPSGIAVANTYPENGILPMPQLRPNCALCNKSPPGATRAMGAGDTHGKADAMRKRQGATNANGRQAPLRPQKKLTTTSRHPTADAAYRPFGTPKRHVSTCETCRFAARNGTSQKAANLTSQPSASQSVSLSSRQPRPPAKATAKQALLPYSQAAAGGQRPPGQAEKMQLPRHSQHDRSAMEAQ